MKVLGHSCSWIIAILVSWAIIGSLNGVIFACSRMCQAGAKHGHLPSILGHVSLDTQMPIICLICHCSLAVLMVMFCDVSSLIIYSSFLEILAYGLCVLALLIKRLSKKYVGKLSKFSLVRPVIFLSFNAVIVAYPILLQTHIVAVDLLALLLGGLIHMLIFKLHFKLPPPVSRVSEKLQILTQKIFLCCSQE